MKHNISTFIKVVAILIGFAALSGCTSSMSKKYSNDEKFLLSFGGDEFDYKTFKLVRQSISVAYVGSKSHLERGVHSTLYEFTFDRAAILYQDGRPLGNTIFMTLGEPPGRGVTEGQTARVVTFKPHSEELLGIGRATLWRQKNFIQ